MDFFYKLFPYQSLLEPDEKTLTAWWVVLIVVIFLFFLFRLIYVTIRLKKKLKLLSENFSIDLIKKNSFLLQIWNDYQASFIDFNGEKKTDEFSYDYFNEKNLISANTNLKLINTIPATLVGIGILGTFVGLTYGISNFQTNSTEEIKESIETLLAGMGTAFISSIHGMLFSLVFTFTEKIQVNSLHNSLHSLCYNLDKKYKISKEDERNMELERQKHLLYDYFIFEDDRGNKVKPGNVLRDIFNESRKQSVALQSFSTDLANLIEAGFEKIINDPDKGVLSELKSLKTEIINLGSKLNEPASEMMQNVVKELEASLAKMIEEFKMSVSGSTKTELENLTTLMSQAGSSLTNFPNKLELMTNNLNENFRSLQEVVQIISKQIINQSEQSTDNMRRQVQEMSEILKNKVGELQIGQEILINKQNNYLQMAEDLLISFNSSIKQLNLLTDQINNTVGSFSNVQGELNSTSTHLRSITENIQSSSKTFKDAQVMFVQYSNEFLHQNRGTIEEIQKSLRQAQVLSSEYSEKFQIIEKGLQGIFDQIENGLIDYRDTIGESIESYLGTYTEALTNSAQSLSSASSKQAEILEELSEYLSKLPNCS